MTYLEAKEHLEALISLASKKNLFLACVRSYLASVEIDVVPLVRAQEIKTIERLLALSQLQEEAQMTVRSFLSGQV